MLKFVHTLAYAGIAYSYAGKSLLGIETELTDPAMIIFYVMLAICQLWPWQSH